MLIHVYTEIRGVISEFSGALNNQVLFQLLLYILKTGPPMAIPIYTLCVIPHVTQCAFRGMNTVCICGDGYSVHLNAEI